MSDTNYLKDILLNGTDGESGYNASKNIPVNYRNATLKDLDKDVNVYDDIKYYIQDIDKYIESNKGLYLFSSRTLDNKYGTGNGKTLISCIILNECIDYYVDKTILYQRFYDSPVAYFVSMQELLSYYNKIFRDNSVYYYSVKDIMLTSKVLVIDDIGIRSVTEAFNGEMYEIINTRMNNNLLTIYTSNMDVQELPFDFRIKSRIEGTTIPLLVEGKDWRRCR
jgi:DNA replication protein DnaC